MLPENLLQVEVKAPSVGAAARTKAGRPAVARTSRRWSDLAARVRPYPRSAPELGDALEFVGIEAGLQTAATLARGLDENAIAESARARGVDVMPLGRYAIEPMTVGGLLLGFAAVGPRAIRRGIDVLAGVIDEQA